MIETEDVVEAMARAMKPLLFADNGRKVGPATEYERNVTRNMARAALSATPIERLREENARRGEALNAVHAAMLMGGDGTVGDFGWSITLLNKARPLIRAALNQQ